jgi:hypothetical protein
MKETNRNSSIITHINNFYHLFLRCFLLHFVFLAFDYSLSLSAFLFSLHFSLYLLI